MKPAHETRVVAHGATGHEARCSCGWVLACVDAPTALRECWTHAKAETPPLPDLSKQDA